MMIKKIGTIVLDTSMWVQEEDFDNTILATAVNTIDGGTITYVQDKKNSAKTMTLESREYQWQTKSVVQAVVALANSKTQTTVTDKEDNIIDVVFAYENNPAVQFKRVANVNSIDQFSGKIFLRRV